MRCNGPFGPPINRRWDCGCIGVPKGWFSARGALQLSVVIYFGTGVRASEFVVGHVGKLVELELVRLVVHLVEVVDVANVGLEDVEPLVLLVEVGRQCVVAPPPLVHLPQALLALQLPLVVFKAFSYSNKLS
ncbi:unnamed protein product [Cuscuta campestris]|uniref:Uncharacterized protein n=1 Tax=Cuscuta campestris TaxID=132261 RepID=A0A484M5F6_9ASTE|nr:unnamed protein product [Cuscuta campestris]